MRCAKDRAVRKDLGPYKVNLEYDILEKIGFIQWSRKIRQPNFYGEFDSGSERTLAACLRHASRTENRRYLYCLFLVAHG